mgnify:FL=1
MVLSMTELDKVITYLYSKLSSELTIANRSNELEEYLCKIGCKDCIENHNASYLAHNAKILVIGDMNINCKSIKKIAKKCGIKADRIEVISEYEKLTNLNFEKYRNNTNYSDIIIGPTPHKAKGIGGYSSVISMMEHNSEEYPKLIRAETATGKLKLTATSFEAALRQTQQYLDNIN